MAFAAAVLLWLNIRGGILYGSMAQIRAVRFYGWPIPVVFYEEGYVSSRGGGVEAFVAEGPVPDGLVPFSALNALKNWCIVVFANLGLIAATGAFSEGFFRWRERIHQSPTRNPP
jgi:hypothetical protein